VKENATGLPNILIRAKNSASIQAQDQNMTVNPASAGLTTLCHVQAQESANTLIDLSNSYCNNQTTKNLSNAFDPTSLKRKWHLKVKGRDWFGNQAGQVPSKTDETLLVYTKFRDSTSFATMAYLESLQTENEYGNATALSDVSQCNACGGAATPSLDIKVRAYEAQ